MEEEASSQQEVMELPNIDTVREFVRDFYGLGPCWGLCYSEWSINSKFVCYKCAETHIWGCDVEVEQLLPNGTKKVPRFPLTLWRCQYCSEQTPNFKIVWY
jgi:hypothetical protein